MSSRGVFCILPTPFDQRGELHDASLRKLTDFQIKAGVHGLAILGFMGEAHKLSYNEREQVIRTVVDQVHGKVPIWVGVQALGTHVAIQQSRQAESLGADAVFIAPINIQDDDVLFAFYRDLSEAIRIPVVIHDVPEMFRILLSTSLIARLNQEVKSIQYIKLEDSPVGPKLTKLRELSHDRLKIFGGLGGAYFLEELQRGAVGTMTGFSFPEVLVCIYEKFQRGDTKGAAETFDRYVPLIRYEFQPKIGLAFRKYVYHKRGLLASTAVRPPGPTLDEYTVSELKQIVERVGLSLEKEGVQEII